MLPEKNSGIKKFSPCTINVSPHDVRTIDELSGRTTGRLGDIRLDTVHRDAIGGTAELALQYYTNLCTLRPDPSTTQWRLRAGRGAGGWTTSPHPSPPGPQDRLRDYGPDEAADTTAELPAPQDLPGNTGRLRAADAAVYSAVAAVLSEELPALRIRRMAMPEYTAASGRLNHATFRERADASVRCSESLAKLLHADRPTGLGPGSQWLTFS